MTLEILVWFLLSAVCIGLGILSIVFNGVLAAGLFGAAAGFSLVNLIRECEK